MNGVYKKGGAFTFLARSLTRRPDAQQIVRKMTIVLQSDPAIFSPRLSLEFWPTTSLVTPNHAIISWQITSDLESFPHQQHEITITKAWNSTDTTIQFKSQIPPACLRSCQTMIFDL